MNSAKIYGNASNHSPKPSPNTRTRWPSTRISAWPSIRPAMRTPGPGDFEKAVRCFERYAAINPGQANPIDSLAELYFRMGEFDKAKAKYRGSPGDQAGFLPFMRRPGLYLRRSRKLSGSPALDRRIHQEGADSASKRSKGHWMKIFYEYFLGRWEESRTDLASIRGQAEKADLPNCRGPHGLDDGLLSSPTGVNTIRPARPSKPTAIGV